MTNPSVLDTDKQNSYISFLKEFEIKLIREANLRIVKSQKKTFYCELGKIRYSFKYTKNKEGALISPLRKYLGIDRPFCNMSDDFKAKLIVKASRTTYQKSVEDIQDSFGFKLCRATLNKYVIETKACEITEQPTEEQNILLADSTKVRNGKGGHHQVMAVISLDYEQNDYSLTAFDVNTSAKTIAQNIDLSKYKAFVGDGDLGLRNFCQDIPFHLCHHHAINDVSFFLWKDGLKKDDRIVYEKKFKATLYTLQNSTKKYWRTHKTGRLVNRIIRTRKTLTCMAEELWKVGMHQAARYIIDHRDHVLTAAKLALVGIKVPWTTNHMERIMQEIGIRTKKKGMNWTEHGLKAITTIVLKRYFLPKNRRNYKEICTNLCQVVET
jgi:hypothetical protein